MKNKNKPLFTIEHCQNAEISDLLSDEQSHEHILAIINFAEKGAITSQTPLMFTLALPQLDQTPTLEIWKSRQKVETGTDHNIQYSKNGEILFGHILLKDAVSPSCQTLSEEAYQNIFKLLQQHDYPYLIRIWNYFPHINKEIDGLERYRAFCLGRQDALDQYDNFPYSPPAATAIGTSSSEIQVYFIAAKQPGIQLENPRQVSAFLYPPEYGKVSPSFSRATIKDWQGNPHIYVSGTASIIGHQSVHKDDVTLQLRETLRNIDALIKHGDDTLGLPIKNAANLSFLKVYLRDAADRDLVDQLLTEYFKGNPPKCMYLQGDVCRSDLLVEIEAHYA